MDVERATDIIYVDLSKAFNTVPYDILAGHPKLERVEHSMDKEWVCMVSLRRTVVNTKCSSRDQ